MREAVTRLASEDLVEATPQRGFRVRPISLEHFRDLTWVRIQIETLALRQSIAKGDVTWEADLVAAHHRLAVTPMYFEDGARQHRSGWPPMGRSTPRSLRRAGSPVLERLRRQLYDASELYRYWAGKPAASPRRARTSPTSTRRSSTPRSPRDADLAVDLVTQHLEATARNLEAIAADIGTTDPNDLEAVVD